MSAVADTQTADTSEDFFLPFKQRHADAVRALGICWLLESLEAAQRQEGCTFQDVIKELASLRVKRENKNEPIAGAAAHNEKLITLSETMYETFKIKLTADFRVDIATGDRVHRLFLTGVTQNLPADVKEKLSEVTVSHILGEAFELYCAISFKERIIPIVLQSRPEKAPVIPEKAPVRTRCKVERVYLSDKVYKFEESKNSTGAKKLPRSLEWEDQEFIRGTSAKKNLIAALMEGKEEGKREHVERFVGTLVKYMEDDKGFDILVQLREIDSEQENIHFIVAQCKFRSPREDGQVGSIDISSYVGKHFDIMEQARAVGVFCPFFWMATSTDFSAAEGYFSKLIEDGSLVIQGAEALRTEAGLLSLINKSIGYLKGWIKDADEHRKRTIEAMQGKKLKEHQKAAVKDVGAYFSSDIEATAVGRHVSVIMATGSGKTLTAYSATTGLEAAHNFQKPSLHISPMIRLVFQNAQEWLAEDIAKWVTNNKNKTPAEVSYDEFPIYYAVCSGQDDSNRGCTSVISIYMSELEKTLQRHVSDGSLKRCRFFTTYQGGALFWMNVRQYAMQKYQNPLYRVFGVAVRDEAHTAAGLGSKPFSAVLNVPAEYSLSFTATPKVHELRFKERDDIKKELNRPDKTTFLHLDSKILLPSVPYPAPVDLENPEQPTAANPATAPCPALDKQIYWHPFDFLSESLFFVKDNETIAEFSTLKYDWAFFQNVAKVKKTAVVVFFVKALPRRFTPTVSSTPAKYDVLYDYKKNQFRYFGPLFPPFSDESNMHLNQKALCFGVNEDFDILCKPDCEPQQRRGLTVHDMSHIGKGNYIGPIIHTLSYQKCIDSEEPGLCGPRVVMLMPRELSIETNYKSLISKSKLANLLGLDKHAKKIYTTPDKIHWNLTIGKTVVEGTALQFRAMQQLLGCFKLDVKPVRRVLVFCVDGKHAGECMEIFRALLKKEEAKDYYVDRIYSSEAHTEQEMTYREQQEKLQEFSRHTKAVMFNVKLIGIGVDMPGIDAVQIVQPATSVSRIVQAYGRAMRLDGSFPDKEATFIIPSVSPFKENWVQHESQPTEPVSTPSNGADSTVARPKINLGSMQRSIAKESVAPPVIASYESVFHLQLKLAKSMLDKNVASIGETFRGTQMIKDKKEEANDFKAPGDAETLEPSDAIKSADYSGSKAETLLKNITSDASPKPLLPILGEELSALLLTAWEHVLIPDLHGELLENPGPAIMTQKEFENACIIFAISLARTFGLGKSALWHFAYKPTINPPIDGVTSKKIGKLKDDLQDFDRWDGAKERIKEHLVAGLEEWGIKLIFGLKPTPPRSSTKKKGGEPSETVAKPKITKIYTQLSVDDLMKKLEEIPNKDKTGNTPATGATPEYTPANTPPPAAPGGSNSNGAGPSSAGGSRGTGQGVSKRMKFSDGKNT